MATEGMAIQDSFIAGVNLSTCQYRFVAQSSSAQTIVGASSGSATGPLGVLMDEPTVGEGGRVLIFGVGKVSASAAAGSAIAVGDGLICSSTGRAILQSLAGSPVNAIALEALATGGAVISALILPYGANNHADNSA